uniref:Receptor-like protein 12 n=1 Tax=Populus alba TaxID=43335 RepID=A0A4U5M021_POPAL|nr:hypothetical protein D5086_0000323540 [Populus alba]
MISVDLDKYYMTARGYSSYTYSIQMTWKGLEVEFVKILSILRGLDLSSNSFTGEIPKPIGKLKGLHQLNLSHNFLTGHIQSSLGFLTNLEALDMSSNMLTGRIPVQLTDLTFLVVLNLSQNKLEGPIPRERQFSTFYPSAFQGNLGLCGIPMPTKCNNGVVPPLPPSNFNEGDGFGWKAVGMGYGCGFVFGVTMGYIVFRTRRPAWFHRMVERQWNLKARRTKKNARITISMKVSPHEIPSRVDIGTTIKWQIHSFVAEFKAFRPLGTVLENNLPHKDPFDLIVKKGKLWRSVVFVEKEDEDD